MDQSDGGPLWTGRMEVHYGPVTSVLHELVELLQEVVSLFWVCLFFRLHTHTHKKHTAKEQVLHLIKTDWQHS